MKLYEYEGKKLFEQYDIPTPQAVLVRSIAEIPAYEASVVKAQVLTGDRKHVGGIQVARSTEVLAEAMRDLLGSSIRGEKVESVLVEELVDFTNEYYVSLSYDTGRRAPVLALNTQGGTGIADATITTIDIVSGLARSDIEAALARASFPDNDIPGVTAVVQKLWNLFIAQHALLAEINPLFKTVSGTFIAGDAKVILDDNKHRPGAQRVITMDGDIAVLASGGGASMLNMDALMRAGGRPANYAEYSGNPSAETVEALAMQVLSKPGLKGCWVVGAAANFTDIYTTLSGLVEALRKLDPKPTYPIVIRRDGPRRAEAFEMLKNVGSKEGYNLHLYDAETPMIETAKIMVDLAYANTP